MGWAGGARQGCDWRVGPHLSLAYNCILWANTAAVGPQIRHRLDSDIAVQYCDIQGGQPDISLETSEILWGDGNIDEDPLFAADAQWTDPDSFINGDCHLASTAGRFDPQSQTWTTDPQHSPCIDAGDPDSDYSLELWPHGQRTNMGAYGASRQASLSTSTAGQPADCTNDGLVNQADVRMITEKWLAEGPLMVEDFARNGTVNFFDFAILADSWQ